MKKEFKIILVILGIIVLLALIFFAIDYSRVKKQEYENNNMVANMKAIVVKVYDKSLAAIKIGNESELISIGFDENIGFKQGQEISVYFDGMIMETYPAQLGNVGKIEIVKEKSDIQIPDNILRYCYSTRDKVNVTVSELTNSGITLTITDTNELPYNYSHSYTIYKEVKNKDYTGIGYKIGEDTENSTAGYTRNRY